ncbi:intradiol ring-cleavage dioxygenase [Aquincola sp. S2]|uniref:Intradiol ring-cleavage dioxygenase n=1 Tax=Pseudaquabacterium terrae TaxID=2732868 RepID=A0ABX2ETP1_9BURK|nr:protocatechuate 3,4-dioxygenase [Aquabacterium terrae]NRF71860.1 intradiol ring-cleavage dioxygenase [Aquabacterium terrae]
MKHRVPDSTAPLSLDSPATLPQPLRRSLVAGSLLLAAPAVWRGALAKEPLRLTPSQTEGPFYPVTLPADTDNDLLEQGSRRYQHGLPVWLDGVVLDMKGRALAGGIVEIWQCDHSGHYHHPGDGGRADADFQGFGRTEVAADGTFRFRTIRPVAYSGRTPHIHVKVKLGTRELLTTQLYVAGDPGNERDGLWRRLSAAERAALTLPYSAGADGLRARCSLVVQG